MRIGYASLWAEKKPVFSYALHRILAENYGINLFFFHPSDVNIKTKTINAWFPTGKGVLLDSFQKIVPFPEIIDDIYGTGWVTKDIYNELCKNHLSLQVPLKHKHIMESIVRESSIANLAIESYLYSAHNIEDLLEKHKRLILKPDSNSNTGMGIYGLSKLHGKYIIHSSHQEEKLNREEFFSRYDSKFKERDYVVQPLLNLKTKNGNPFDVRLTVARGINGAWTQMMPVIRIGHKKGLVSNIEQEGYLIAENYEVFLKMEFGRDADRIVNELDLIAKNLPDVFQKHLHKIIPSMGIDIGIDRDNGNALKFIETNNHPYVFGCMEYPLARARVNFYKYVIANYDAMFALQQKTL